MRMPHKRNGTQTLIALYYVFGLLALVSSCITHVWRFLDPSLILETDDTSKYTAVKTLLLPAYWGLLMTVVLSMYQLGIVI